MVLIFCLRIRMPRLSEGLILHVRQHEIVWKYIIWTYSGTEEAELWQSRQSRSAFTSLGMKADLKCETTDLLQSRQKGSVEAELPIFGNESRVLVEKPIFRSLAVKIERKCRSETANLGRDEMWKRNFRSLPVKTEQNFTYLAVKAERKCGSGTSHFWQSMQNESADAVKAERKCGSGTSGLWQLRQSRSVEAEFHIFSRQDRAEVQASTLTVQSSWTCGSRS